MTDEIDTSAEAVARLATRLEDECDSMSIGAAIEGAETLLALTAERDEALAMVAATVREMAEWCEKERQTCNVQNDRAGATAYRRLCLKVQHFAGCDQRAALEARDARIRAEAEAKERERIAQEFATRSMRYYPIEMPVNAEGRGPASVGQDAVRIVYEVWEADTFNSIGSFQYLSDAIAAAIHAGGE